jgi:RND family efflux transporter MFP subunit
LKTRATLSMAAAFATLAGCASSSGESATSPSPAVRVITARIGTYVKQEQAVGRVGAAAGSESKLSFAESGILQDVYVRIGEHVAAGEALAALDTSGLSLAAAQAQADAQAAQANLQQARIDRLSAKLQTDRSELRREGSLYAAGVAAYKDVQAARAQLASDEADAATARTQISGARAQTQSAQDRALLAQRDLSNGTLRAPAAGIVTAIYKRPGEAVEGTTPVVAIGPLATGEVTLDVSAADAAQIRNGDPVEFSVPGTRLRAFGRIDGVSSALDPATQTATVTASGVPSGAPSGSAVQASIDVARERGIVVPQSAIVQDPQSGATLVFVQTREKNGKMNFTERTVNVADQNGTQALIASGLRRGERIAAQGGFALLAPAGADNGD